MSRPLTTGRNPGSAGWQGPWLIHFFARHRLDDPRCRVPGRDFLDACLVAVAAKFVAILKAVAEAPPPAFSGGGKWEAMHGDMSGYYEARADGPSREHHRLFCILERDGAILGLGGPSIVVLCGASKAFRTKLAQADYAKVRRLGAEFLARTPRCIER